ncbi:hypothetical protein AVEN_256092-1 [Araneus ventricosus]|uniref:Uncharacterized protein n=1 Tax=Araneus ventricosus TaxID=182803 RepID=A0A4Y2D5L2_ARAVE|nr:hypothetical protein AVEN_256092-1 [Araneus ventricosus]
MGSLVSVQLRKDANLSFLIRSSEKLLCDKRHSIHRSSYIKQGVKKALCVVNPLLRFPTVQVATWRDQFEQLAWNLHKGKRPRSVLCQYETLHND